MTDNFFNTFYKKQQDADIDLLTDTIVALLLDNTLEPDIDLDEFVSDIVANEIAGGGYARKTLASKTTTVDNANDLSAFDGENLDWSTDSFSGVRYVVLFKNTGADATSALICYFDLVNDRSAPVIRWAATGIFAHKKSP